jgi:hypothetical protein
MTILFWLAVQTGLLAALIGLSGGVKWKVCFNTEDTEGAEKREEKRLRGGASSQRFRSEEGKRADGGTWHGELRGIGGGWARCRELACGGGCNA